MYGSRRSSASSRWRPRPTGSGGLLAATWHMLSHPAISHWQCYMQSGRAWQRKQQMLAEAQRSPSASRLTNGSLSMRMDDCISSGLSMLM